MRHVVDIVVLSAIFPLSNRFSSTKTASCLTCELVLPMVGRTKSQLAKRINVRHTHGDLMARAVTAYEAAKKKSPKGSVGYRTICKEISELHFQETGERVELSHATLQRRIQGGASRDDANEHLRWLSEAEETIVVDYLNEMGDRSFPYSHRRAAEVVNKVASAHLGDKFPKSGVGINWTYRFSLRNGHRIKLWNSRPLEEKQGRAANPHTMKSWWELLEKCLTARNFTPGNIYGSDEVGVQAQGQGETERVFGRPGKSAPYQQRAGTRENITMIITICADGTAIPPTAIFKGKAFHVKWAKDNLLKASFVINFPINLSLLICIRTVLVISARDGLMVKLGPIGSSCLRKRQSQS